MVSIGIIGTGFMGRTHCAAYEQCAEVDRVRLLTLPQTRDEAKSLAAACPKVIAVEEDAAAFFDSDIDAVDICTPTPWHAGQIRQAIAAHKAVMCEKPLSMDPALCEALVREAEAAGVPFMAAQVIRFWPEYQYFTDLLRGGSWGRLRNLSLERYSPMPGWGQDQWFKNLALSGGTLFDLHIHDIDFLLFALGKPRRISSIGYKRDGLAYTDISTTLDYGDGTYARAYGSYEMPATVPFRMNYRALFEQGALEYDLWRNPALRAMNGAAECVPDLTGQADGYVNECRYFVHCVAQREMPVLASAASATWTIRVLGRIAESADQGGAWMELA